MRYRNSVFWTVEFKIYIFLYFKLYNLKFDLKYKFRRVFSKVCGWEELSVRSIDAWVIKVSKGIYSSWLRNTNS